MEDKKNGIVHEEKHEENEEVLGAPGTGEITGGKDVRVVEDEGAVRRLMSNFIPKDIDIQSHTPPLAGT